MLTCPALIRGWKLEPRNYIYIYLHFGKRELNPWYYKTGITFQSILSNTGIRFLDLAYQRYP